MFLDIVLLTLPNIDKVYECEWAFGISSGARNLLAFSQIGIVPLFVGKEN